MVSSKSDSPDFVAFVEGLPQLEVLPASSGSPQPVAASVGFPQAAVPLSTQGLEGEPPLPQPEGATKHKNKTHTHTQRGKRVKHKGHSYSLGTRGGG